MDWGATDWSQNRQNITHNNRPQLVTISSAVAPDQTPIQPLDPWAYVWKGARPKTDAGAATRLHQLPSDVLSILDEMVLPLKKNERGTFTLDLSNKKLTTLNSLPRVAVLIGNDLRRHVDTLDLSNNLISAIEQQDFQESAGRFSHLNLDDNKISSVTRTTFRAFAIIPLIRILPEDEPIIPGETHYHFTLFIPKKQWNDRIMYAEAVYAALWHPLKSLSLRGNPCIHAIDRARSHSEFFSNSGSKSGLDFLATIALPGGSKSGLDFLTTIALPGVQKRIKSLNDAINAQYARHSQSLGDRLEKLHYIAVFEYIIARIIGTHPPQLKYNEALDEFTCLPRSSKPLYTVIEPIIPKPEPVKKDNEGSKYQQDLMTMIRYKG